MNSNTASCRILNYELPKRSAILELSYNCSFACPFCYVPWIDHPELYGIPLTSTEWISAIDSLFGQGVEDITISGGEPLLSPGCCDILCHLAKSGKSFCLYTNGEFLDESVLDILKGQKCRVSTSLQGIKCRGVLTGSTFSLDKWKARCRSAVDKGIPLLITIPVTKLSLPELPNLLRCAAKLNPYAIQVGPILIEGRARYHPELWMDESDFNRMKCLVEKARRRISIPIHLVEERFCACRKDAVLPNGEPMETEGTKDNPRCHELLVIGPDGRSRQCLHTWTPIKDYRPDGKKELI